MSGSELPHVCPVEHMDEWLEVAERSLMRYASAPPFDTKTKQTKLVSTHQLSDLRAWLK
jgi:hypothetical protein